MNWLLKNFDAIIINFIFLVLSYFLTNTKSSSDRSQNTNTKEEHVEKSNINLIRKTEYKNSYITNHYKTTKIESIKLNNSSSNSSEEIYLQIFLIFIIVSCSLYFFYRYYNAIDLFFTIISFTGFLSSLIIFYNAKKDKENRNYSNNLIRHIKVTMLSWGVIFLNNFIVYLQVNKSKHIYVFLSNFDTSTSKGLVTRLFTVASDYPFESLIAFSIMLSYVLVAILLYYTLVKQIFVVSDIRLCNLNLNTYRYKFWYKINKLVKSKTYNIGYHYVFTFTFLLLLVNKGLLALLIKKMYYFMTSFSEKMFLSK